MIYPYAQRMVIGVGLAASTFLLSPAFARYPVNDWLCKSLAPPFDAMAVIAKFPLERLPPALETRTEKQDDEDDYKTIKVKVVTESEDFEVTYSYQFKSTDVGNPYGLSLRIYARYPLSEKLKPEMDKWLAEFGKPERASMGRAVYAGPELYEGGEPVFKFERWGSSAVYGASWWRKGDMKYAQELCK